MTIKLIRMWSGEDVIADVIEENEYTITMENPIVAVPSQQPGQIGFGPWCPLHKKGKIKVSEGYVVYMGAPQPEIIEQYNSMYGKISTPTKKLIN